MKNIICKYCEKKLSKHKTLEEAITCIEGYDFLYTMTVNRRADKVAEIVRDTLRV